jgi:hypothetical protein
MELVCSVQSNTSSSVEQTPADRKRTAFLQKLLVPDLAIAGAILTLILCLFLFDGTRTLFRDADSGWHIRIGERILDQRAVPAADPFSFTKPNTRWFAWEWLADIAMAATHRAGGITAVAFLYAMALAACTWLWFQLHWTLKGNFLVAAAMAFLFLSTANLHWLARPHVFSWLFLIGAVLFAECASQGERLTAAEFTTVLIGSILWANIHGSFFLGAAILFLYAAGFALRRFLFGDAPSSAPKLAILGLVAIASTLANPYGWALHQHVFAYLTDRELIDRIGEFQSFNFHDAGASRILLTVLVAAIGCGLALTQREIARFFLGALLLVMALRSARGLPILALIALPLANGAITNALQQARHLRPQLARRLAAFLHYSQNLRAIDGRVGGWLTALAMTGLCFFAIQAPAIEANAGFPRETFPVRAASAVERLDPQARILAPDLYGGYLIYRFNGQRPVFFDGRSDFYGSSFLTSYIDLMQVRPGWREVLDGHIETHGITHALLPIRYSLVAALEQDGWRALHRDSVAVLLERPESQQPKGAH